MSAALLPPECGGPGPWDVADRALRVLSHMPPPARAGLSAATGALDAIAVATHRRRLVRLDHASREDVLDRAKATTAGRAALDASKAFLSLVAGAHMYAETIRARATRFEPARPDADMDVTDAMAWPSSVTCDVVVVGSGAGGAMAARTFARAGADVVVVEEGRRFGVDEFRTRHPADRFAQMYRDAGATIALGLPPVALPLGRGVGGTTLVNSGTCYRPPDAVQQRWRDEHGLELAGPDVLGPHLDEVERTLQVAPVDSDVMGRNGQTMLAGAAKLGWRAGPLRRNAPGCAASCQCAIGCPRNAKFGVHLNALPQACQAGARIVTGLRVDRIVHAGGRADGVVGRRADGTAVSIAAGRVVVAAGATETPPLLRRSGLGSHPRLGRNLALHPALSVAGRFEEPIVAWEGVLQSAAVEQFHHSDGILIEATATPPGMGTMTLPGYGARLVDELRRADHLVTLGAMVGDSGRGRVLGRRRTVLTYDLAHGDGARLVAAIGHMGRLLFAAGATEVLSPTGDTACNTDELDDAVSRADVRTLHLAAFHPTGTAAAGSDGQRHPVDESGCLRGVDGVLVADASIVPSCPEVNPQVSIMALALAVAGRAST